MSNRELLEAIKVLLSYLTSSMTGSYGIGSDMVKEHLKSLLEEQTRRSLEQKDE